MMASWWFVWMLFMFVFFVPTLGYGWGYRSWGPPFPRYVQRQRSARALAGGGSGTLDHHAWGVGGDVVWAMVLVAVLWIFGGLFWL